MKTERRIAAVSRTELERRWGLIREFMTENRLDALICVASDQHLSGYARWLTDSPYVYRKVVLFFRDELMTIIEHGKRGETRNFKGDNPYYPGVGEVITVNEVPSVHYTQAYEADIVLDALKARKCRRIGLAGPKSMPYGFLHALDIALRGKVEFFDATEYVDHCKAIKSAEEIEILKRCARIQDDIFQKLLPTIHAGMRDCEVAANATFIGRSMGCESGIISVGSAPSGEPAHMVGEYMQGRTISDGDVLAILIENAPLDGYYTELTRSVVIGRAPTELIEGCEQAREAQSYTLSLLKPGVQFRDVYHSYNEFLRKMGLEPEERLFAHGQGYDLIERPLLRQDECMIVAPNICLAIHPSLLTQRMFAVVCDNYIIGPEDRCECLHRTAKKVFEL